MLAQFISYLLLALSTSAYLLLASYPGSLFNAGEEERALVSNVHACVGVHSFRSCQNDEQ